jgi:inorganic triphosphatase YgiF
MPIEKNFRITDPGTFWSLQTIDQLGEFLLSTDEVTEVTDTYLDTRKRRLLTKGYSCCKREPGKKARIILTKLGTKDDVSHQLKEWRVKLKKDTHDPADWPDSKVRTRVIKIIPEKKLQPIFVLRHTRITRSISKDDQVIAQANLDDVSVTVNGKDRQFKTLKLKVTDPEQEKQLKALISTLQANWKLKPEPLTNFERALEMERGKDK